MPYLNSTSDHTIDREIDTETLVDGIGGSVKLKSVQVNLVDIPTTYRRIEVDGVGRKTADSYVAVSASVALEYSLGYTINFNLDLISRNFGQKLSTKQVIGVLLGDGDTVFDASLVNQASVVNISENIKVIITDKDFLAEVESTYMPTWDIDPQHALTCNIEPCGIDLDEDMAVNMLSHLEGIFSLNARPPSDSFLTKDFIDPIREQILLQAAAILSLPNAS